MIYLWIFYSVLLASMSLSILNFYGVTFYCFIIDLDLLVGNLFQFSWLLAMLCFVNFKSLLRFMKTIVGFILEIVCIYDLICVKVTSYYYIKPFYPFI